VWIAVATTAHTDAEARTEAEPTRLKRPEKTEVGDESVSYLRQK